MAKRKKKKAKPKYCLETALLNVLMYFPNQEIRALALEAMTTGQSKDLKKIVKALDDAEWHNIQAIETIRKAVKGD